MRPAYCNARKQKGLEQRARYNAANPESSSPERTDDHADCCRPDTDTMEKTFLQFSLLRMAFLPVELAYYDACIMCHRYLVRPGRNSQCLAVRGSRTKMSVQTPACKTIKKRVIAYLDYYTTQHVSMCTETHVPPPRWTRVIVLHLQSLTLIPWPQ